MSTSRLVRLHGGDESGDCVIYVMSRDQRSRDNFALLHAQAKALERELPLVVVFNLLKKSGNRSYEHAEFMLQGLEETAKRIEKQGIPFVLLQEDTTPQLASALQRLRPAVVYFDFSPLHGPRAQAKSLAKRLDVAAYVVDAHNVIPVWTASDHQEFAAHTFRPKVHKYLEQYLEEPDNLRKHPHQLANRPKSLSFKQAYEAITGYPKRGITIHFKSGETAARKRLRDFINQQLEDYAQKRNDISGDYQSDLSPYLHFGQLASLRVALEAMYHTKTTPLLYERSKMASRGSSTSETDGMNALFEEMIVRKELADNFCFYAKSYTSFRSVPAWAQDTLRHHNSDRREQTYTMAELEAGKTRDESWNAAQMEMAKHGKMHGYMRMYWAKKILEWTPDADTALKTALYLNDAYTIDGGDPNGYVGMLWAIGGLHDRPWTERPIFGKIRYMNEAGLKRKYDIGRYRERVMQK